MSVKRVEQMGQEDGSGQGVGLRGRRLLLGITGGIAAYKAPMLVRALLAEGAEVRCLLTRAGGEFVATRALETMSRHPVYSGLFDQTSEFPVLHVGLAEWADLALVAPATAHFMGKMAAGLGDDLLSTLLLGFTGPILLAPAMEENMWQNALVQRNCRTLVERRGCLVIEPARGALASGAEGLGRMPEPEELVQSVVQQVRLQTRNDLSGMRLLVTAGPTLEDIDPVRFISNRSSGKMGYALAQRARERGAEVVLVTGPTALPEPDGVEVVPVRSALEMKGAVDHLFDGVDGAILAAAVADYRAAVVAEEKIKRSGGAMSLELVENPDIAAELGARRGRQILVAFAMETEDGPARARAKLERKRCDLIVLNNLKEEGAGFGVDTNVVTLIEAGGGAEKLQKMSKLEVADRILDRVESLRGSG